jgi:homoserine acetyltransferase
VFGIERVKLVYGFSMGAQQAFHWGALFPDRVERIAPICGSAKTSPHNFVFLEGVKAALTADPAWQDGWFATPPTRGFQAMGRVYAGWGLSQAFYREEETGPTITLPRRYAKGQRDCRHDRGMVHGVRSTDELQCCPHQDPTPVQGNSTLRQ